MDFKQYLVYFGWSQANLARRIGVSPDTVSRWKGQAPQVVLMYLEQLRKNEEVWDKAFDSGRAQVVDELREFFDEHWGES